MFHRLKFGVRELSWTHARERVTYTEAETRDKGERAAAPDGEHRKIKRAVLGSDFYTHTSSPSSFESGCVDKPSKMGHGPLGVMYPESLKRGSAEQKRGEEKKRSAIPSEEN